MSAPARRWRLLLAVLLLGVAADQATKFLAVARLTTALRGREGSLAGQVAGFYGFRHLEPYATEAYVVVAPLWRMRYAENPGAAWGLFRDLSPGGRDALFSLITLAAVAFILVTYRRVPPERRLLRVALSLVLAGAVGNFLDRLARGYVVDFIDWHWWNRPDLAWPTFNLADSMIVVGVILLVLHPAPAKEGAAARE